MDPPISAVDLDFQARGVSEVEVDPRTHLVALAVAISSDVEPPCIRIYPRPGNYGLSPCLLLPAQDTETQADVGRAICARVTGRSLSCLFFT